MRVLQRVEEIRTGEHMRLRQALQRASHSLRILEEETEAAAKGVSSSGVDMWGEPIKSDDEPDDQFKPSLVNVGPLIAVWQPFEAKLLERVDTWEMDLWPLVRRWVMGEPVTQAVQTVASGMLARRTKLEPLLKALRTQVSFVGKARAPVMAVFSAMEACDEAEAEIVPALISGKVEQVERSVEGVTPRVLSSAQVARNLRSNTRLPRPEVRPANSERSGVFGTLGRMMGWKPKS